MPQDIEHKEKTLRMATLINEPGEPVSFGCNVTELKSMICRCREIDITKPFCAVENWMVWDAVFSDPSIQENIMVVYANKIFRDETGRFVTGGWVCSTVVQSIHEECIFSTKNTHYILLGTGTRKPADASDILTFYRQ